MTMSTQSTIYPVITLYQPWATWIMREWKTIETRTHDRFKCLKDKVILIHAGQTTDKSHLAINNPYLSQEQLLHNPEEIINGHILGSVFVNNFSKLSDGNSSDALIECNTERWGLFLSLVKILEEPIPVKGEMGIWYFDIETKQKVKKLLCV